MSDTYSNYNSNINQDVGVVRSDTSDQISVGNEAGDKNSLNMLRALKAHLAQARVENKPDTSLNTLRRWIKQYAVTSDTLTGTDQSEFRFSQFTNAVIFGGAVRVKSEQQYSEHGFNYDHHANGSVQIFPIRGGGPRGGTYTIGEAGTRAATKATYYSPTSGTDDDGDFDIPVEEQFALEADTAGTVGNGITLNGSDDIRPSFSGTTTVISEADLDNSTSASITITGDGTSNLQQLTAGVTGITVNEGSTLILVSGEQIVVPATGNFTGDVERLRSVSVEVDPLDEGSNDDFDLTGDGTSTIKELAEADDRTLTSAGFGDALNNSQKLANGVTITFTGGSDGPTLATIVANYNAGAASDKQISIIGVGTEPPNTGYLLGTGTTAVLNGGEAGSGAGSIVTAGASKTFTGLGGSGRFTPNTTYSYVIIDNTTNEQFSFDVDLHTRGTNEVKSVISDDNSFNTTGGVQVIFDAGSTRANSSTDAPDVYILCKPETTTGQFET